MYISEVFVFLNRSFHRVLLENMKRGTELKPGWSTSSHRVNLRDLQPLEWLSSTQGSFLGREWNLNGMFVLVLVSH